MTLILQFIGLFLNIIIAFTHDTRKIYGLTFLFNAANLAIYLVTGDSAAAISGTLITVRSLAYIYKDRMPKQMEWLPWVFCLLHVYLGMTSIVNLWQVLTIIAPCTVCLTMWYWRGKFQKLRVGHIINASCWLVYNLYCGLYIIAVCRVMTILANTIALYKNRNTPD